jgi:hypothetical protein
VSELHLGAGGEAVGDLPGVTVDYLEGDVSDLISYDKLCEFTFLYASNPSVAAAMCEKLKHAQAAEERGRFKTRNRILKAYQHHVAAQSDQVIAPQDAAALVVFAEMLKSTD